MPKLISDRDMSFDEYKEKSAKTASYPDKGLNLIYPILGLCGEAGELAEKIKKLWRNKGITSGQDIDIETRHELVLELGDCLWYVAAMAYELNVDLSEVAWINITKLLDRQARGVIKSEGDHR